MLNIYEKFRRKVIELNHLECKTYEEAIKKELIFGCLLRNKAKGDTLLFIKEAFGGLLHYNFTIKEERILKIEDVEIIGLPITLPRVMQALKKDEERLEISYDYLDEQFTYNYFKNPYIIEDRFFWKLTKENGVECTHLDQTKETIIKLNYLIK